MDRFRLRELNAVAPLRQWGSIASGVVGAMLATAAFPVDKTEKLPRDAVEAAQTKRSVPVTRSQQKQSGHDKSARFSANDAPASSPALENQPDRGRALGFDFARDPLNAKRPMQSAEEIMKQDIADKPKVTATQRRLLEARYDLTPKLDPDAKMSRGKPLAVGPTARLAGGMTWERLAAMSPEEIRSKGVFPYPSLPHPKQATGGQVFPQMQIDMFPRLERFDVEFDLPDAFLPEFPPAIFLQGRPAAYRTQNRISRRHS